MIIISGATGQLGSQIVAHLLQRVPAHAVGVSVRDPARAADLAERGVRVRRGDFTDPTSLEHAFQGATQVLVVSAAIRGPGALAANCAAIDAARAAGAERILYTSHQAASAHSLFAPQVTHAATEVHLAQRGVPYTALRHGFYASTIAHYVTGAVETGQLIVPEDGPVSWTAHEDLAEAAAVALAEPGRLDGVTAPLTAPELLDFEAVAQLLSDLAGRRVERVVVTDEAWTSAAVGRGLPPAAADFALGMFRAARRGEFAVTDPTLEAVTGHPATTVKTVLERLMNPRGSTT